jgi:RHS repeat-associated protein
MFAPRISADVKAEHIWLMPDNDNGDGYEPLAIAGPSTITFVHGDHLGAPALLTDSQGAVVNRYDALPFGQRWASLAASPTTALAFPGQLIDAVDRHYNLHRDYDPTLGRYLQADPIGLDGGDNPYAYAEGNAVRWIDPSGQFVPLVVPGLCAAGGCEALIAAGIILMSPPAQDALNSLVKAGAKLCDSGNDKDDFCYKRWEEEDSKCGGYREWGDWAVRGCRDRAATRRDLCIRNGGRPSPTEPNEWSLSDITGRRRK